LFRGLSNARRASLEALSRKLTHRRHWPERAMIVLTSIEQVEALVALTLTGKGPSSHR
jgi:hypothetical protein